MKKEFPCFFILFYDVAKIQINPEEVCDIYSKNWKLCVPSIEQKKYGSN